MNLRKCVCPPHSLLNWKPLFSLIKFNVNNLRNRNINHWKEDFGKSAQVSSDSKKGSKFWLHNKLKTWLNARVLYQNNKCTWQKCSKNWNVKWSAEYLSLNTESYVDINLHVLVKCAYQENWSLLSEWWKDCNLLVKLVLLMLNSRSNQVKQPVDWSIKGFRRTLQKRGVLKRKWLYRSF